MSALTAHGKRAMAYGHASFSTMVCDRAMLIVDFCLATTIPYLVQLLIWQYVYKNQDAADIAGFGYHQLVFYYAYALALARLNNGYDVIAQLSAHVHEGRLEVQLTKPFPYPLQKLFGFLGESSMYFLPLLFILCVQIAYAGTPTVSYHPAYVLGMTVLVLLSQVLCFTFSFCIGIASFWIVRSGILLTLLVTLSALLSGILLPPDFWPSFLRPVMAWNPLRFMVAAPAELMVKPDNALLGQSIAVSIAYCLLFAGIACMGWCRGLKGYHSVGG